MVRHERRQHLHAGEAQHATVQRQKLEACAAGRLFRHILVGGEEIASGGHEKPHPSIFHK